MNWNKIEDGFPKDKQILLYLPDDHSQKIRIGTYLQKRIFHDSPFVYQWHIQGSDTKKVPTHWMELIPPSEKKEDQE